MTLIGKQEQQEPGTLGERERDNGDREPGDVRIGISKEGKWKWRHRDTLEIEALEICWHECASLVNPLIPLARISQIGQKYSQHGHLPCVIFLKVARWWKPSQY